MRVACACVRARVCVCVCVCVYVCVCVCVLFNSIFLCGEPSGPFWANGSPMGPKCPPPLGQTFFEKVGFTAVLTSYSDRAQNSVQNALFETFFRWIKCPNRSILLFILSRAKNACRKSPGRSGAYQKKSLQPRAFFSKKLQRRIPKKKIACLLLKVLANLSHTPDHRFFEFFS